MPSRTLLGALILQLTLVAGVGSAQTGAPDELAWSALTSGGGAGGGGALTLEGTLGQLAAGKASGGDFTLAGGFWAVVASGCPLDVDQNGNADLATDVVYIARYLLGLTPVPPSFRVQDPSIPADAEIIAHIIAAGTAFDVDADGDVDVATDAVYIARHLLGLTPVPPSFRVPGRSIPADAIVAANVDAACP
jgi:hypothetical protein